MNNLTKSQLQAIEWLANGETGLSSETMCFYLAFGVKRNRNSHPFDPADLDRCLRFLEACPEYKDQIYKLSDLGVYWNRLINRWPELVSKHIEEVGIGWTKEKSAPLTYKLMKEILEGK